MLTPGILLLVIALAVVGYFVLRQGKPLLIGSGCQAGRGAAAVSLDPEQAAIAATIAGVAHQRSMPSHAVMVAYAAALQESKLHNLDYGDRDSVGIFQQRPSEGWGSATELQDPVYATTKFYAALTQVHGYARMPVYQAAQKVQHSADGSAYQQWTDVAGQLAGYFTGKSPHSVSCWFTPSRQANLAGAERQIRQTFGPVGQTAVVVRITTTRSGQKDNARTTAVLHVQRAAAWTVASWLVAHAQAYHLSHVRYAGFSWNAASGSMGWQRQSNPTSPSGKTGIVAG